MQVKIRSALNTDIDQIKELGNNIFGNGYLDNWSLPGPRKNSFEYSQCFIATKDAKIIGMIYFFVRENNPLEQFKALGFDVSTLKETVSKHRGHEKFPSLFLSLIMVNEQYRRQGVGSSLYEKMLQICFEVNANHLYSTVWKESPSLAIIPFLEKQEWKIVSSKEKYWYEDSLKDGYQCAQCGNPCCCTAVLMNLIYTN